MNDYVKITAQCVECGCDVNMEVSADDVHNHKFILAAAYFECCQPYEDEVEPNFIVY